MARSEQALPDPPRSLEREHAAALRAHTEAAFERQRRELAESLEAALGQIPWPLRGAVRRVMGL
jgi:hypothetical protein